MTDITSLAVEMDNCDQAVLTSSDVEYDELTNLICTAEDLPHVREILPVSGFNGLNPMPQSRLRIWVLFPKLFQRPTGYQTHLSLFSQYAKIESTRYFRNMRKQLTLQQSFMRTQVIDQHELLPEKAVFS
jgi:hypothetical protein